MLRQEAKYVLHLYHSDAFAADPAEGPWQSGFFLHMGFVNFSTWQVGCLQLDPCCFNKCFRTLMLQVSLGENEHPKVLMLLEFVAMNLDTTQAYNFQLYRIVGTKENLIEDFMKPCFVDVRLESTPVCFWRGDASESIDPKPPRKRPADSDTVAQPRPRPRPRREPQQQELEDQHHPFDEPCDDGNDECEDDDGFDSLVNRLAGGDESDTECEHESESEESEPEQEDFVANKANDMDDQGDVNAFFDFNDLLQEAEAEMNIGSGSAESADQGPNAAAAGADALNEIPEGNAVLQPEPVHPAAALDDDDNPAAPAAAGAAVLAPDEIPAGFGTFICKCYVTLLKNLGPRKWTT